ncbi:MAG: DUF192 domain-containing protein [Phenylobacterium sp.]|uniref:DUF192 domain-containing protein n=1 Tax=Phenylobacterium sp. TaxID=1871053 RepID=UPI00273489B0|nr:DUF192 domain-containing protein [Phenylobacterium sp.]MDP3748171.1 DUF192 domain-containing protein [Phenylobacterium sp.]
MSRMTYGLRAALAGALALCAYACAAEPAPAAKQVARASVAAAPAKPPVDAPVPAGLEALEVVTPQGRTRFLVEIADDEPERNRGLMYRKVMAPDRGMLFDFHTPREVAFWMKNTLIPLDIIYIQADGTVLSIARNTTPLSEAPIPSGGPILGVLELAGGRAAEIGLLPGDKVVHRIFQGG